MKPKKSQIETMSDKKLLEKVIQDAHAMGMGEAAKFYGQKFGVKVSVLGLEDSELYKKELLRRLHERSLMLKKVGRAL